MSPGNKEYVRGSQLASPREIGKTLQYLREGKVFSKCPDIFFNCAARLGYTEEMVEEYLQAAEGSSGIDGPSIYDQEARVYFLWGAGRIKIGFSYDVPRRVKAIRASSPVPLYLLGVFKGGESEEGVIHDMFIRYREHGEWFRDAKAIRQFIADECEQLP